MQQSKPQRRRLLKFGGVLPTKGGVEVRKGPLPGGRPSLSLARANSLSTASRFGIWPLVLGSLVPGLHTFWGAFVDLLQIL
jgi:hypothetical protein